nr:hypothetical protein [Elizabethkingia sp. ASV34]
MVLVIQVADAMSLQDSVQMERWVVDVFMYKSYNLNHYEKTKS